MTSAGLGIWLAVLHGWFLSQRAVLEEEQILGLCRYREASQQPYSTAEHSLQPHLEQEAWPEMWRCGEVRPDTGRLQVQSHCSGAGVRVSEK